MAEVKGKRLDGRILRRKICTSVKVAILVKVQSELGYNGWLAAALFDRLIASQDDEGRFEGDPVVVRNLCFTRHQECDVSSEEVTAHLGAMHRLGLVIWYRAEGGLYLCLPGFADNQSFHGWRPSPSDRPAPPEAAPADPPLAVCSAEEWSEVLSRVQGAPSTCSAPASHQLNTNSSPALHQLDTDPGEKSVESRRGAGASRVRAEPEQNRRELEQKGDAAANPDPSSASSQAQVDASSARAASPPLKTASCPAARDSPECAWCARPLREAKSAVHRLLQQCHDTYRQRNRDCPTLKPGKHGKLLQSLLKAGKSEERISQVWAAYLESADPLAERNGHDIETFVRLFDGVARAVDRGERHGEARRNPGAGARRHLPSPESEFSDSGLVAL